MVERYRSKKIFSSLKELQRAVVQEDSEFVYGRGAQPIVEEANRLFAHADGRESALGFASGMGAITAVFCALLKSGDHLIINQNCYSWTRHFVNTHLVKWGVEVTWLNDEAPSELASPTRLFRKNTRLLFLEAPTYSLFDVPDFEPWIQEARARKITSVLDNTYSGPANFSLAAKVDITVYSATKTIVGNGLDLGGFVASSEEVRKTIFKEGIMSLGAMMSWRVAEQMIAGLESYGRRTQSIANETEQFLRELLELSTVERIYSPWIRNGRYSERADFRFPVGLLSVDLRVETAAEMEAICNQFKVFKLGVSYGAPEALAMPASAFRREGHDLLRSEGFVRLSLGEEKASRLIADLKQATLGSR